MSLDQLDPIQSGRPCWNMAPISGVPGTPRVSPGWTGQSSEAGPEEGVGLGWARTLKIPFPPKPFHDSMIYFQIIPNSSAGGDSRRSLGQQLEASCVVEPPARRPLCLDPEG